MLRGVSRVLLMGTLFCAPLAFGAVQAWAWGTLAIMAFLLLLLWSVSTPQQGVLRIAWSPLYLPAAAFFLLVTVQYSGRRTFSPIATREALFKLATDLIFFFLAGQLASSRSRFFGFSPLIPLYTFALALFAIFQFLSCPDLIYWTVRTEGWPFGPYVNHNHYAGLMEMLIPLAAASVLAAMGKYASPRLFSVVAPIPVASLLLSGSRGGVISLAVETLMAALLICIYGPARLRKSVVLLGGSMVIAGALLFVGMAPEKIVHRLATMEDERHSPEAALAERFVAGRDSLRLFRAHLPLGVGMGAFETAFPQYQSFSSDLTWDHAHNDYAELLAETGVAGGTLLVFSLGLFFWLAFRNLRERLAHPVGWIPFGASLGCCGLLVHSLVDFNLHIPANAAWFAVSAAIAVG
jgi:O-antigen ligase